MALRYDPAAAAMMAAALAGDNTTALTATLGRAPRASELYLAHFLGTAGATRLLGALGADPGQPAAALLPKAAAANPGVFYDSTGAARSVGSVMALIQSRMDTAMAGGPDGSDPFVDDVTMTTGPGDDAVYQASAGPIAQQFAQAQASASGAASTDPIAGGGTDSMSDTLRAMFGMAGENGGAGAAPAFVRSAYGQMQALGL